MNRAALELERAADAGDERVADRPIGIVGIRDVAAGVDDVLQVRLHGPPGATFVR